jgi:cell division protein FtsL
MKKSAVLFISTIVGAFAVVVVAAVLHVSLRTGVTRTGYLIGEKLAEGRELEEEARKLRLELSLLHSPERVERLAREKLGMVRPDPERIRVVRPGTQLAENP